MIAAILWQTGGAGSSLGMFLPMIIVMGIFYVMLILPQQRQRKKTQAMLAALKNGDKVVTTSGIYGTVNGGGPEFELRTFNGDIFLRRAK